MQAHSLKVLLHTILSDNMMEINNNGTIIKIYPSDESELTTGVMTSGKVELHFRSDQDIKLEQGATIEFLGNTYTLVYPQETKKLWRGYLEYIATFYSSAEQLKHKLLKDPSNIARTSFVFAGSPTDFATLVARSMGHEWSVGNCVATSYDKTIAFKEESCWAALGRVAEEFHTEWVVEGKSISLRKDERYKEDPLPLSYGKGNGFLSGVSQRGNADNLPISRLYVLGSSRNIDPTKYGASTLHLPKSWSSERMRTDEAGNYIELLEGNGAEGAMELSDLYPHRVGVVSSVVVANEAKHFYDIIDSSIPEELNYNDYRIRGEKAILKFETGALAGRQFEIRQSESALSGYHHQERRFELIPSEQDGFIMPSKEWAPKAGDKYAIFGIALPEEYVTRAENELLKEAIRTLSERSLPQFTFEGEVDGIWAKRKWLEIGGKLVPGGHVLFSDPEFHPEGTVIRITSMAQKVNNPTAPSITLSTALVGGSLWNVLNRAEAQEVLSQKRDRELQRSQRQSYEQALQHIGMVERAVEGVEGFSKRIKPSVIETMGLLVGSQATQLDFVERYGSLKSVPMAFNYNPTDKRITISNAFIRHQTIGITSITNARKPTDYRYWSVARYTSPALTDTEQSYYIYAKVEREGKGGNYLLSPDPLPFETTTHYHLLVGTLSSLIDGDRAYNRLYGFSMVTPGQILTDTISSANGNMTIDLQNGSIISDQIEFRRPDGSKKSVEEVITDTVQVGGRNLLRNKDIIATIANQISVEYEQVQPKEGRNTYTLSFEYWIDENDTATSRRISLQGVGLWIERVIADSKWHRFEHTIQLTLDESKYPLKGWLTDYSSRGNRVPGMAKVRNIKLERGTVATDWSPAPEDVQADIEAVERGYQKLIERVDVEFAISNSRDTAPTSGWQTNAPTPARGQALWQRTKVYLKDGTTEVRGVTCIQGKDGLDGKDGAKGGDGADGRGITKIVELYYLSSSNTALGNGAWSETAPTPKEGFWIWTKTRIHYTTGEQIDTQPICVTGNKGDKGDRGERGLQGLQGKDGTNGLPGRDGVDGKTSYTHIAYADTVTGGGFSQSPAGKAYIGMYVDFVQTDSTNPKKYAWSLIKGADGKNGLNGKDGVPGKPGVDGRTPYLHIAYANSQDGKQGFSVSVSEGKSYIGTYTDYTQADSTDPTKYSWSKIKGEDAVVSKEVTIDASGLDENVYYPIAITNTPSVVHNRYRVYTKLFYSSNPSWATHSQGFQCELIWKCFNSSWGGFDVNMQVEVASYKFVNNVPPISQPSQMVEYSVNYTYVRGGGKYYVELQAREQATLDDIKVELVTAKKSYGSDPYIRYLEPQTSITAPITDLDKEAQARAKAVQEINAGLSNANTLIATLEKTAKELKEGKLDTKDLPDLQYLLNALQKGDTKIAGGLVLSKIIALSNQVDRITAYLSGYDGTSGDGKILRAGIQYTKTKEAVWPIGRFLADYCGYKNLETVPHVNNVITKEALFTWLRQQKEPFEKFNKALSGGTVSFNHSINSSSINLLRINAIIYSHSDSNSEAVAIRHDGTGHFGDIHLNGDRIDYQETQDANPYLTVGRGTYSTIEEVIRKNDYRAYNPSNITNKSFDYNPDWNTADEQVSTVEIEVANDNTKVTITVELMQVDTRINAKNPDKPGWVHTELQAKLNGHHIKGVMEMYNYGYNKEMPADPEYSSEHWDSNREAGRPTDETGRREWRLVKGNKSSRSVEHSVILPKGTHQLEFVFTQVASSDKHSLPATARVEGIKVLQEFKTDFKQALISPTGARFYGGRDRYFDINYNAYSNAPTAQLTGGLKVDYIDMPGVPLCGAMVKSTGAVVKSFGKYKNKRGEGYPKVSYSYSTRTYTVHHSIPHSNYIPMLTVGNCHYSDQANYRNISAYSFDVNITNYQMAYQQQDFSYICFLSE